MKKRKLFVIVSMMLLSIGLSAQPTKGERPSPPKMRTPKEIAKEEADKMKAEINLSDKQYKKVYNLILQDEKYRQSQAENQFGGGMPPQGGGPGGMGGPGGGMMGGGPGGMGGSMGGGMMGGGTPPQEGMGQGQRPDGAPGMGPGAALVSEEYLEKQDKKLKKILSAEQYDKWRENHPAEHLELPPLELQDM